MVPRLRNEIAQGATFYPDDRHERLVALRDEVVRVRQCYVAAFALQLADGGADVCETSGFLDAVKAFADLSANERQKVVEYPPFLIWLQQACKDAQHYKLFGTEGGLIERLNSFPEICQSGRLSEDEIAICRFDVDPLLAEACPPSYTFPSPERAAFINTATPYTLEFFSSVARIALDRIGEAWPDAGIWLPRFVRTIVHAPDGDFRSVSASRYTGVVLLASSDETLLDMEESLVHEFGHQVLYWLMELDPIFVGDASAEEFTLPWSGAKRDLDGYFHAFYIYILLAAYYLRVRANDDRERDRVAADERLREIIDGLDQAVEDFAVDAYYTAVGKEFAQNLRSKAQELIAQVLERGRP